MLGLIYPTLLFVHILSALALFAVEGLDLFAMRELRAAKEEGAAHAALARLSLAQKLVGPVPPLLLLSGLGLCALTWGFQTPWVDLSLLGFVTIAVLVRVVDTPRLARLQALMRDGATFGHLHAAMYDPALRRGSRVRLGLLVWLVGLMTVKPGWVIALVALLPVLAWTLLSPPRPAPLAVSQPNTT